MMFMRPLLGSIPLSSCTGRSPWMPRLIVLAAILGCCVAPSGALVMPQDETTELQDQIKVEPFLRPGKSLVPLSESTSSFSPAARGSWSTFLSSQGPGAQWTAVIDQRSGLIEIAEGSGVPWIPGRGNGLDLADMAAHLRGRSQIDLATLDSLARVFMAPLAPLLGIEGRTLVLNRAASGPYSDYLWLVDFDVYAANGLKIEGARLFFRVNNGNLVQFGAENLPPSRTPVPSARLSPSQAMNDLETYLGGFDSARDWISKSPELILLPVRRGALGASVSWAEGYDLLPVWQLNFHRQGMDAVWLARIDAVSGRVVEFRDSNSYAQVSGGYWPVSWRVNGVQQGQVTSGWPFATVNPTGGTANTSGIYAWDGTGQTARHQGPYVNINDNCAGTPGTQTSDGSGDIDFGTYGPGGPGDCTTALGINDNTAAARQQYWHLNKIKEKGRAYLPANAWLQASLTANVNINNNCNAFWNGVSVNFYTSGGGCNNTGEDAGIALHEWGHGMDSNDGNGSSVENGTGETYGDFSAALQTHDSCTGQGFLNTNCGGYGNACSQCDGVRDIDWGKHSNNAPMTVASFTQPICPSDSGGGYNGPCGNGAAQPNDKEGHCESYVSSGALWDLAAQDLRSGCGGRNAGFADYNCPGAGGPYNEAGAWQTVDRLWYLSRSAANQAFTCTRSNPTWTSDGCNAGSNWKTFRLVDDDDGNLANGTPHACQIAAAFNRHGIGNTAGSACAADVTTCFRGCPQPATPTLNPPTAGNNQVTLGWSPDPSPDVIDVFRNEVGCSAGFTRIANDVSGSSFVDADVANGSTYYYQVVRHPVGTESCASAPSVCLSGSPVLGPSAKYVDASATLSAVPVDNDADGFVDNCETGRLQVAITNDGSGALSNVRFTVTSSDGAVTIDTAMPVNLGGLAVSSQTTGSFDFSLDGASCGQSAPFDIAVTADEMSGSNIDSFSHGPVEQDLALTATRTDDFETGTDGWSLVSGYQRENVTAASGAWSVHSTSGADDRLDVARSPIFRQGAGATSVIIAVRYDIENPFWDRANVHAVQVSSGVHTVLTPSGRTYTAGGPWNPVGHVGTEAGWAGTNLTWGDATFDLSTLTAGQSYYLEINYNTDVSIANTGHWFDQVRWSNVSFQGCDAQDDLCVACTPPAAPTGLAALATTPGQLDLSWSPVAPQPAAYRIYRSTSMGGPYAQVGSVGGAVTSYNDLSVTAGVTYYYVVRAFDTCESSDSNGASATPFGDCSTAPSFAGLSAVAPTSSGGSCGLRLAWSGGSNNCGGGPVVYNVYRSTSSGFLPGPGNLLQACVTTPFFDDTTVTSSTTYYYVVQAEDDALGGGGPCRNGNVDGNVVELSGSVGGSGSTVVFQDDFDGNQSPSDAWAFGFSFGSPGGGCPATYSDLWYRPETGFCTGNTLASNDQVANPAYGTYVNGAVILGQPPSGGPPFTDGGIVLPATATSITLTFNHDYDFEPPDWDGGRLLLSADNWPTFTTLTPLGGYPGTVRNSTFFCHPWPGGAAYIGDSGGCVGATFDLTAFAGQRVWLTWNHGADDFNTADDGWMIDDVQIIAVTPASCNAAPEGVQFLTATASQQQNVVEWLNPAAGGYGSTVVRWSSVDYPADVTDGTLLVDQNDGLGGKGSFTHGGLSNATTYYYSAFVDNGSGETSSRKTVSARPFDSSAAVNWAYSTGATALAPPGVGSVFAVSNDRVLHSMDTAGGTGTWPSGWTPLAMNGPAQGRPAVVPVALGGASKVAFLGSQEGRVYAVDADTGQQLWSSSVLGGMVQAGPAGMFTQYGGVADLIFAGTRNAAADNEMVGLNLADGTVAWSFTNSLAQGGDDTGIGMISATPSLDYATSRAYFTSRRRSGGSSNTVWCIQFDGTSATLQWARDLGDIDTAVSLVGGVAYVGTSGGLVHALDATTGADLWGAPWVSGDGPVRGPVWPDFGTSDILFSTSNRLWSVTNNGASASLKWSVSTIPDPSPPLALPFNGGRYAWVGSSDGRLYQLDIAGPLPSITSVLLGDGSATTGSPALDTINDIAYVGAENGRLYAVSVPLP